MHKTTWSSGAYRKDPGGWHVTFSHKTEDHIHRGTHITCHGCVRSPESTVYGLQGGYLCIREGRYRVEGRQNLFGPGKSTSGLWRVSDIYMGPGHLSTDPSVTSTSIELGLQGLRRVPKKTIHFSNHAARCWLQCAVYISGALQRCSSPGNFFGRPSIRYRPSRMRRLPMARFHLATYADDTEIGGVRM